MKIQKINFNLVAPYPKIKTPTTANFLMEIFTEFDPVEIASAVNFLLSKNATIVTCYNCSWYGSHSSLARSAGISAGGSQDVNIVSDGSGSDRLNCSLELWH